MPKLQSGILVIAVTICKLLEMDNNPEAAISPTNNLTSYPVSFIRGIPSQGNFVMTKGLALSDQDTYHTFVTEESCTCRRACLAHPPCLGVSSERGNGKVYCKLTKKTILQVDFFNSSSSTFIFKTDWIPHRFYGIKPDNRVYVVPNENLNWNDAKTFCSRIPGHRLGIFQTEQQYNALMALSKGIGVDLWVDLRTESQLVKWWGDGTKYDDTSLAKKVSLTNNFYTARWFARTNTLTAYGGGYQTKFVCQATPV